MGGKQEDLSLWPKFHQDARSVAFWFQSLKSFGYMEAKESNRPRFKPKSVLDVDKLLNPLSLSFPTCQM